MSSVTRSGEYKVDKLQIISSTGVTEINFEVSVIQMEIIESLFSNTIFAEFLIIDNNNLISNMHFTGQEFIILKISMPSLEEKPTIEKVFSVLSVTNRNDLSVGAQAYMLNCASPEILRSNRVRVNLSYTDTISNIVKKIMREDTTLINSNKRLVVEKTSGVRKFVAPNVRPFDFIKTMTRESISTINRSSHYLFFENLRGFHFVSLQNLYKEAIVGEFEVGEVGKIDNETKKDFDADMKRLLHHQIDNSMDTLVSARGGLLGSNLIKYNIFNKNYEKSEYNYFDDFNSSSRLNKNPIYNKVPIDKQGKSVGDFQNSRIHLHPTSKSENKDARYNDPYVDNHAEDWLLSRRSRMQELMMGQSLTLTVHGRPDLTVGDTIQVTIPSVGKTHGESEEDVNTGKYLIRNIRHSFFPVPNNHIINMSVVADSSNKEFNNVADATEPELPKGKLVELSLGGGT